MLKKIVGVFLVSSFCSFTSYALPKFMMTPAFPKNQPSANKSAATPTSSTQCANFTGKWKGSCLYETSDGGSSPFEQELQINQENCSWLTLGTDQLRIGSNGSQQNSFDRGSFNSSTGYVFWSESQNVLTFRSFDVGSFNSEESTSNEFGMFHSDGIAYMQIDHEQKLQYRSTFVTYVSLNLGGDKKSEEIKFSGKLVCSMALEQ